MFASLLGPANAFGQSVQKSASTISSYSLPNPTVLEEQKKSRAEFELSEEEHQRVLGVIPNFNTSETEDAQPLSSSQKLDLAAKSTFDPFSFVGTGLDATISQAEHKFPAYHMGAVGYSKRFGSSFADSSDSTIIGNALLPILLKQDPRYFRLGSGSFQSRLWHSLLSAFECKDDNGRWAANYSNVLGNLAAGAISNLYYPSADRGALLTLQRGATITVEGAIGNVFFEFWPDISRKLTKKSAFPSGTFPNSPLK